MKKIIFIFFFSALFVGIKAQTPWYLTGNGNTDTILNFIGTTDKKPLIFKTRDTERMKLLSDRSFLGIGVTNPQATLHLHFQTENLVIDPLRPLLQLTTNATGNAATNGFAVFSDYSTREIRFKQQESAKFFIEGQNGGMVIAQDGKIGVGTDAPEEKVHLVGKMVIDRTASTPSSLQFKNTTTRDTQPQDTLGGEVTYRHFWDVYSDPYGLKFNTVASNGYVTQSVVFGCAGFVGIGVTSPQARLHVGQHILADGNITTREKLVLAPDNTGKNYWDISRTSTGLNYAYTAKSSKDILFLGNDGNIGIGKTDPASKLDINGTLTTTALTTKSIIGDTYLDGKLGIGITNNPLTNLQIGENWTFQNTPDGKVIRRNTYHDGTTDVRIQSGVASRISFHNDGDIQLQTATKGNTSQPLIWKTVTLANNGDVTIGTTTQSAMLEVNGNIKGQSATITEKITAADLRIENLLCAKEIKVQVANCWPDYVFGKDYNLMPLNKVEQFITQNQHLPNVPSAAEVEANGVNLGEMNTILLQKVEELTLYIIDLQKQIDELKAGKP